MMRSFFEAIQWFFETIMFAPHNFLRHLELSSWFGANFLNWIFMAICAYATYYWCKQLTIHHNSGEDEQDTTAHSFLK